MESLQRKSIITVGGVEVSVSFACRSDLELILRAAKAVAWKPSPTTDIARLLVSDRDGAFKPIDFIDVTNDCVTVTLTVTNAWLPRLLLMRSGADCIDKNAHVYLHYKFYDKDSTTSNICPAAGSQGKKSCKERDPLPVKLVHRKSFLCRATQPLVWYLREELLEIQVWLTHSRSARCSRRPLDVDKLLGVAQIEMSSLLAGGLHKQQHVSGSFPMFKPGAGDMAEACVRLYFSVSPGDHTRSCDVESEGDTLSSASDDDTVDPCVECVSLPEKQATVQTDQSLTFPAVVSVEKAMHLPTILSFQQTFSDEKQHVGCYVSYQAGDAAFSETVKTRVVEKSSCPVWDDSKEVMLSRSLLQNSGGNLLFRVWQSESPGIEDKSREQQEASDRMIGFATVDISTLKTGFKAVNGWYNIIDIHGNCQGQIKVAVAPTTDVSLLSPTSLSRKAPQNDDVGSSRQGILYSVPLVAPVETPSGSMYFPGVCSEQTVGTTCKLTSTHSNLSPPQVVSYTQNFAVIQPTTSLSDAAKIPSRSIFAHEQQQTCLLQTLQRQMKELDHIKENFQRKIVAPDATSSMPSTNDVSPSPAAAPFAFAASCDDETHADVAPAEQVKHIHLPSSPSPPDQLLPDHTDLPRKQKHPAVHMSLFKSEREVYDEGAALSDTELSGIEFVQPKNLNQQELDSDEELGSTAIDDRIAGDANENRSSLQVTLSSSELNNTSLWLSASASHADETPDEADERSDLVTSEVVQNEQNDSLSKRLFPDVETSDAEDQAAANVDQQLVQAEEEEIVVVSNFNEDITEISPEEKAGFIDELLDAHDGQALRNDLGPQDVTEPDDVVGGKDVLLGDLEKSSEISTEEKDDSEMSDTDGLPTNEKPHGGSADQLRSPQASPDESSNRMSDHNDTESDHDSPNESVADDEDDETTAVNGSADGDGPKATSSSVAAPHPSSGILPSFFPPTKDLIASMRFLQALTTEQQVTVRGFRVV